MRQMFSDMLRMQDKLNKVVNLEWIDAGYPWYRAMAVEAVEALDHYGWKWWKAEKEADIGQIQLELVDIWHFAMSNILAVHEGDFEAAATELSDYFSKLSQDPDAYGEIAGVSTPTLFDLLIGSAALQRQLNGPAFNALMTKFDLSWSKLYQMYIAKNVLNLFRQANGYKEGTYIKTWDGVEDNVVLERLMAQRHAATPDELTAALESTYATVKPV